MLSAEGGLSRRRSCFLHLRRDYRTWGVRNTVSEPSGPVLQPQTRGWGRSLEKAQRLHRHSQDSPRDLLTQWDAASGSRAMTGPLRTAVPSRTTDQPVFFWVEPRTLRWLRPLKEHRRRAVERPHAVSSVPGPPHPPTPCSRASKRHSLGFGSCCCCAYRLTVYCEHCGQ